MLNWLVRYAAVADELDRGGSPDDSVLDVGCGPHGLSCIRPDRPFVGLDVTFPERVAATMTAIQAPPGRLPFVDGAFDTVLSLDTLEHMPAAERPGFVQELARVSARRVVLVCPEARAAPADELVASLVLEHGQQMPPWLSEHIEYGLPAEEEVGAICRAIEGCSARPFSTVNALLSLLAVVGDVHPALAAAAAAEYAERAADWERLFLAGRFGPATRTAWVIERDVPLEAVATGPDADATLLPALRCPACEGSIQARSDEVWACTMCDRLIHRDAATGAWVLVAEAPELAPAPIYTPAPSPAVQAERDGADALRARITDLEAELARTTAQLTQARGLRLVRWTEPLRLAIYRARTRLRRP